MTGLRIGSLCSGYGGLDLAAEQVFGAKTAWHCELEKIKQKNGSYRHNAAVDVLAAHWPGVPNHGDMTTVDWDTVEPVDILTGGYPCQPFSTAGKRQGEDDERNVWPEVREAIRRVRPRLTFLENVPGHRTLGFDRVLGDLAEDGMHVRWTSLRAADVGSCHARERLFIVVTPDATRDGWPRVHDCTSGAAARGGWEQVTAGGVGDAAVVLLPTPAASRSGRNQSPSTGAAVRPSLDMITDLLPTPSAADGGGGHLTRSGDRSDELLLPGVARAYAECALLATPQARDYKGIPGDGFNTANLCRDVAALPSGDWGKYEPAIRRWENLFRPAPSPTEPNTKGNPRLAPPFPEWMMGLPAGWVTGIPGISRNDQLRIIGNGVVPQQAVAALRWLLSISEVAA